MNLLLNVSMFAVTCHNGQSFNICTPPVEGTCFNSYTPEEFQT